MTQPADYSISNLAALAAMTKRDEFLTLAKHRLDSGHMLTPEDGRKLLDDLAKSLQWEREMRTYVAGLVARMREARNIAARFVERFDGLENQIAEDGRISLDGEPV